MAFDLGRGLASMGESISKTVGVMSVEAQRSELEKQKLILADQLSTVREEKDRTWRTGESDKQRGWQGSENEKGRAADLERTKITANASVTSAGISAGATIRSQQIASEARLKEAAMTDSYRRDELEVNKGLKESELKTPTVRTFEERQKMSPEQRAEYDAFIAGQKEPKTPFKLIPNDGNPLVINEQTGEVRPGSPAGAPAGGGKRLETSERKELKTMADPAITISTLADTFKPSYGGALTETTGDARNAVARNFSWASPDSKERASWWQQYQAYSNIEQNKLYGAVLSAAEMEKYKKATVTPNMSPDMISANLKTQQEIQLTAIARYSMSLLKDGYKPESIEAVTGLRFYGNDRSYASFPVGTIYIAPDGRVMRKTAPSGNR